MFSRFAVLALTIVGAAASVINSDNGDIPIASMNGASLLKNARKLSNSMDNLSTMVTTKRLTGMISILATSLVTVSSSRDVTTSNNGTTTLMVKMISKS